MKSNVSQFVRSHLSGFATHSLTASFAKRGRYEGVGILLGVRQWCPSHMGWLLRHGYRDLYPSLSVFYVFRV